MKKASLCVLGTVLVLAACGRSANVARFTLALDTDDAAREKALVVAATNVANRVVTSMGKTAKNQNVSTKGKDSVLELTMPDEASVKTLTDVLTSGFSFRIMEPAPVETADVVVEQKTGKQGFRETGITEQDLDWVEALSATGSLSAQVRLDFTPAGHDLLTRVFRENQGKDIGLFVRERLISTMHVSTPEPEREIFITGVPSRTVAEIFADDVNVGLHVQYIPAQ